MSRYSAFVPSEGRVCGTEVHGGMFSLLSGLVKWLFEREETNVLIVGVDNAGKTVRPGLPMLELDFGRDPEMSC